MIYTTRWVDCALFIASKQECNGRDVSLGAKMCLSSVYYHINILEKLKLISRKKTGRQLIITPTRKLLDNVKFIREIQEITKR